jgi:hypothetical protein
MDQSLSAVAVIGLTRRALAASLFAMVLIDIERFYYPAQSIHSRAAI